MNKSIDHITKVGIKFQKRILHFNYLVKLNGNRVNNYLSFWEFFFGRGGGELCVLCVGVAYLAAGIEEIRGSIYCRIYERNIAPTPRCDENLIRNIWSFFSLRLLEQIDGLLYNLPFVRVRESKSFLVLSWDTGHKAVSMKQRSLS